MNLAHIKYRLSRVKFYFSVFILALKYVKNTFRQMMVVLPENDRKILFTLDVDRRFRDDDGSGRYPYLLLHLFCEAGYNVYLYKEMSFRKYYRLRVCGQFIYYLNNFKIISRIPAKTDDMIYAFDTARPELLQRKWKKLTYINILKPPSCKFGDPLWIPYPLQPRMFLNYWYRTINRCRKSKRKIKMFFGGNVHQGYYNNPALRQYNQLTRLEGIKATRELTKEVQYIEEYKKFSALLNSRNYTNACVLFGAGTKESQRLPMDRWFKILSQSDFFLCLSGTDLPMCHNAIEAMAVGTIPVISYPDWFFPTLEHKKNAIIYSDRDDLKEKILEVLNMKPEEILKLRKNVIEYYEKHLTGESFIKKHEALNEKLNTIMLHPRLKCTQEEVENSKEFMEEVQLYLKYASRYKIKKV